MASRGVAGTLERTLIVNLPGSARGATEYLTALLASLRKKREGLRERHARDVKLVLKISPDLDDAAIRRVLDPAENPYNVLVPGKRPRVTLTPTMALKDGAPYLAFAVQGGDTQDQNLLQFFLNVVEFGMTVQQAAEAPNVNSHQMRSSFGQHESRPGLITVASSTPEAVRQQLQAMGYTLEFEPITSGPINAVLVDHAHGTLWGGSSHHGEDYGIAW